MVEQNSGEKRGSDIDNLRHDHAEEAKVFDTSKELTQFYSDKLEFLWGKYLTVVHLLISFAGATVLVFFNSIKISELKSYSDTKYAVLAIIAAVIALVFALSWRLLTQFFMEREIFGSSAETARYFKERKVLHVTSTHKGTRMASLYRLFYAIVPVITILSLLFSWGLLTAFISSNFPIAKP